LLEVRSKLSFLFANKILRELDNKKVLFYKFSVRYLVVKLACVNAAYDSNSIKHFSVNVVNWDWL